ncbi:hypothetical protein DLJ53_12175 [Acuticoccus sediminis]|uniref:Autotransporter domain-containing protein n=1 Tax=Acuticoccus sediminis TaxID=2184697 RepID=A0A8B2NXN2_9HYPH|nr:hypothetical protein [Acuticoccus sediminis]RAI02122.1 hypothetical protein DLJ53_12175 [Acuticoccus sediminis]
MATTSLVGVTMFTSAALALCPPVDNGGSQSCTVTSADPRGIKIDTDNISKDGTKYDLTIATSIDADTAATSDGSYVDSIVKLSLQAEKGDNSGADGGEASVVTNSGNSLTLSGSRENVSNQTKLYGVRARSSGGEGVAPDDRGDDGGDGGDGSDVYLGSNANVTILPSAADAIIGPGAAIYGVYALSEGGKAGDKNENDSIGDQDGGDGGHGGDVTVETSGTITLGSPDGSAIRGIDRAWGVAGESKGETGGFDSGKGGEGRKVDINNTAAVSIYWDAQGDEETSNGVRGVYGGSFGGDGVREREDDPATGAEGGPITISTSGNVTVDTTAGNAPVQMSRSGAIVAISEGGNGGASEEGGDAGDGGSGATGTGIVVNVDGTATLTTRGDNLVGIYARSTGGNGGAGSSDNVFEGDANGGQGGVGGLVTVHLNDQSSISTSGRYGYGVVAQSIGGIGGNADDDAGDGGDARQVTFSSAGSTSVETDGEFASAIVLQSVGGGGGVGDDFTGILSSGGNGGEGGVSGAVYGTVAGEIETNGDHSYGVVGQSIAGAGGAGGADLGVFVALGGDGGNGGVANSVDILVSADITTHGLGSVGLLGQSISGGGGAAGAAGGGLAIGGTGGGGGDSSDRNGAGVYLTLTNDVVTTGDQAPGVVAQSIGGGGGLASGEGSASVLAGDTEPDDKVSVGVSAIGGSGGAGGDGGEIAVALPGAATIYTDGDYSHGVQAQSVGGGGGTGGDAIAFTAVVPDFVVGGSADDGGDGDDICITSDVNGCGSLLENYTPRTNVGTTAPTIVSTSGDAANAILAQSIGGGGGFGGAAVADELLSWGTVGVGGNGGHGGDGGDILVDLDNAYVITGGVDSSAIFAQSIGGGGGIGGWAATAGVGSPITAQVGGFGGGGGSADSVTVNLSNSHVTTAQTYSNGILAQSVGGGGGKGGSAFAVQSLNIGFTMVTTVGGSGGDGGDGGKVDVGLTNTTIDTGTTPAGEPDRTDQTGDYAFGILAQSIGGGGGLGNSGTAYTQTIAVPIIVLPFEAALSLSNTVGGSGGGGGDGGEVSVSLDSSAVTTRNDGSIAIMAQSVGGGGGSGADAKSVPFLFSYGTGVNVSESLALGGRAGSTGDGDTVDVTLVDTTLTTSGDFADGILAQSIGGGGGNAGAGTATDWSFMSIVDITARASIGGDGGAGGTGGDVTVSLDNASRITTTGDASRGIIAQSVGGGGGMSTGDSYRLAVTGGEAVVEGEVEGTAVTGILNFDLGNAPGDGGAAGMVTVADDGDIYTSGFDSDGILAQSIGGSGGIAGQAGATRLPRPPSLSFSATLSIGGKGGTGGHGGNVEVTHTGQIVTSADWAEGIIAQSVGGGGGTGGTTLAASQAGGGNATLSIGGTGGSGNNAGQVAVGLGGVIVTEGAMANAVVAQSVGGGGGIGGIAMDQPRGVFTVGGDFGGGGGKGGDGNDVLVTADPTTYTITEGDNSIGILAQSIGGGGGLGAIATGTGADTTPGELRQVQALVGGSGGGGGDGDSVTIEAGGGFVQTSGRSSYGVLAQSIGGGGGLAATGAGDVLASVSVGGQGGEGGDGGVINISSTTQISTTGESAHGLIAQSIGGGGGLGGEFSLSAFDFAPFGLQRETGSQGDGGDVTLDLSQSVTVTGDHAWGVVAQSIGGGGGLGADADGSFAGATSSQTGSSVESGDVSITTSANAPITASGVGGIGIFAQSQGGANRDSNNGTISLDIGADVTGGLGADARGIVVSGGSNNTLVVRNGATVTAARRFRTGNARPSNSSATAARPRPST